MAALQHFDYSHLAPELRVISAPFHALAQQMVLQIPDDPQLTLGLQKLVEAKDCMVRAARVTGQPQSQTQSTATLDARDNESRWRPIDSQGNISPNPAPENPDEPDEGETGPEELQG
jgi:hypothetical protein